MKAIEKGIVAAVDALADDILDLASKLVAEPSTLGNEASALKVMEDEFTKLSFEPVRVPIDPVKLAEHPGFAPVSWRYEDRFNLVATRDANASGGHSALFNGHLDVVSEHPLDLWNTDPYQPTVKDGWLYGRGAGDMKSGLAAMVYAVKAIDAAGLGLRAPVIMEAVIEEECSGNGTLACLDAGYDADAVLIPEFTGLKLLMGQLGILWFKVSISGKPAHVLEAETGVNAIEKCYPLMSALRNLEEEMNQESHPGYAEHKHPINLNIGTIKGGDWPSTIPAMAEFECRLSFFPGKTYQQTRDRIVDAIHQYALTDSWLSKNPPQVEFYGFRSEGHSIEDNLPAFSVVADCHRDIREHPLEKLHFAGTTDVRAFHFYGRSQATSYGPVARNAHAANECVEIDSVISTAKVYALFLSRWCGIVE